MEKYLNVIKRCFAPVIMKHSRYHRIKPCICCWDRQIFAEPELIRNDWPRNKTTKTEATQKIPQDVSEVYRELQYYATHRNTISADQHAEEHEPQNRSPWRNTSSWTRTTSHWAYQHQTEMTATIPSEACSLVAEDLWFYATPPRSCHLQKNTLMVRP